MLGLGMVRGMYLHKHLLSFYGQCFSDIYIIARLLLLLLFLVWLCSAISFESSQTL